MVGEWPRVPISHLTDPDTPVTYGVVKPGPEDPGGVLFIRGGDIADGRVLTEQLRTITSDMSHQYKRTLLRGGEIVVSLVGNPGQVAIVPKRLQGANIARQVGLVRLRDSVDTRFVKYFLSSSFGQEALGAHSLGSVQQVINLRDLKTVQVPTPPLSEQRAIACILGTLDDKIELNRRMNQTLEAMARAIFKSWFVDFDPVHAKAEGRDTGLPDHIAALFPEGFEGSELGAIPRGWDAGVMGDLCEIARGGAWGDDGPFDHAVEAVCLRGVDLGHLRHSGWADAPRRWFKPRQVEERRLDEGDVLVAASGVGPLGRSLWVSRDVQSTFDLPVIYSNFCKRLRCGSVARAVYIDRCLELMRKDSEIWTYATGTSIPNLDCNSLLGGKGIAVPPEPLLDCYLSFVHPVNGRLYSRKSRSLAALRDTLLPKLISGDLRVPDAERMVGRCVQ